MFSPEELKLRLWKIGSSLIAAIAGIHPYMSMLSAWLQITGRETVEENLMMRLGTHCEAAIAEEYAAQTGRVCRTCKTIVHPEHPWACMTPDLITCEPDGTQQRITEIKFPQTPHSIGRFGSDGSTQIPPEYVAQITWQMWGTGIHSGELVASIYGELRTYPVAYNEKLAQRLFEAAAKFHRDYIVTDTAPPIDDSESAAKYIADRYPESNGKELELTAETDDICARLHAAKTDAKEAATREATLRHQLMERLGEHQFVLSSHGRATYKGGKAKRKTDWQKVAVASDPTPEIIEQYTTTVHPRRILRTYFKGA